MAKCIARHAVHHVRQEADKVYENIDPKSSEVYHLFNQFRRENADVVGDKPVKNDAGEISMSDDSKQEAWVKHYQRFSTLTGTQTTCLMNHQWKAYPSQSVAITIDILKMALRWWAKHRANQAVEMI